MRKHAAISASASMKNRRHQETEGFKCPSRKMQVEIEGREENNSLRICDDIELTSDNVSQVAIVFEFLVELAA